MKGYRTLVWNVLIVLAGVFAFLDSVSTQFSEVVPVQYAALAAILVGCINVALRIVTTTPWGEKD